MKFKLFSVLIGLGFVIAGSAHGAAQATHSSIVEPRHKQAMENYSKGDMHGAYKVFCESNNITCNCINKKYVWEIAYYRTCCADLALKGLSKRDAQISPKDFIPKTIDPKAEVVFFMSIHTKNNHKCPSDNAMELLVRQEKEKVVNAFSSDNSALTDGPKIVVDFDALDGYQDYDKSHIVSAPLEQITQNNKLSSAASAVITPSRDLPISALKPLTKEAEPVASLSISTLTATTITTTPVLNRAVPITIADEKSADDLVIMHNTQQSKQSLIAPTAATASTIPVRRIVLATGAVIGGYAAYRNRKELLKKAVPLAKKVVTAAQEQCIIL